MLLHTCACGRRACSIGLDPSTNSRPLGRRGHQNSLILFFARSRCRSRSTLLRRRRTRAKTGLQTLQRVGREERQARSTETVRHCPRCHAHTPAHTAVMQAICKNGRLTVCFSLPGGMGFLVFYRSLFELASLWIAGEPDSYAYERFLMSLLGRVAAKPEGGGENFASRDDRYSPAKQI